MQQTRIRRENNSVPCGAETFSAHLGDATPQPPEETTSTAAHKLAANQCQANPVAGRGRRNAWLPLFPSTQVQRPTSFPKDASLRKLLFALPAEMLAGRTNGQRRTGTKTFERLGPSPPHTTNTQTHTTTLRHFREIRLRQRQTRWSPERLRCSSPRHHCTCSNCSRARAAPSHWHVFSVSYLHAHARLRPRGAEERGAGRKSLPSGRQ